MPDYTPLEQLVSDKLTQQNTMITELMQRIDLSDFPELSIKTHERIAASIIKPSLFEWN